ncbi:MULTISPECIES: M23 family metallopeptidase [Gammaproteobacteria]|uniref:M23 family metallopeptidase n=1 Tax=Gammaproteobacteria TaxID=1236 RepID=UPI000DCFE607|nr:MULTISPECIES: M23 family metallopeptidase [Gammaproteobacteria]RTE87197.1 M23 family metallopeptidase [Aliidiomarina sp. B3213]TCZ93015.1 M23 family metallopeptidase [Lysobacter sp. N42]
MRKLLIALSLLSCTWVSTSALAEVPEPSLRGEFTQGGIIVGKTTEGAQVTLDGEPLKVSRNGDFVFGFGRDVTGSATLSVTYANGDSWEETFSISEREFDIQRIDGLPSRVVTPDPEVVAEIRQNSAEVWEARQPRTDFTYFASNFIWPAEGPISGVYGSQRVLNGEPRTPHYGVDVAAPTGTPVVAPANGVVTLAHKTMVLSGGTLIIDHGHGVFSSFLHLNDIHVEVGDYVEQGAQVGEIGETGRATGPHLDWRINWGNERLDPEFLVPARR